MPCTTGLIQHARHNNCIQCCVHLSLYPVETVRAAATHLQGLVRPQVSADCGGDQGIGPVHEEPAQHHQAHVGGEGSAARKGMHYPCSKEWKACSHECHVHSIHNTSSPFRAVASGAACNKTQAAHWDGGLCGFIHPGDAGHLTEAICATLTRAHRCGTSTGMGLTSG
jgi:hypothetical protein